MSPLWLKADRHIPRLNSRARSNYGSLGVSRCDSAINLEPPKRLQSDVAGNVTNMENATPASQKDGIQLLSKLLETATVRREDFSVVMSLEGDGKRRQPDVLRTLVMRQFLQAREAAMRAQQANNLKQIMLALHNYESAYGHLPPAVFTDPNTGVARSWRVEILPFIDQGQLYSEYRKDEPWDSENNLKVLDRMPAIFRQPGTTDVSNLDVLLAHLRSWPRNVSR